MSGYEIPPAAKQTNEPASEPAANIDAAELQRRADRISALIVGTDYPSVDIEIEIRQLRRWCAQRLPDRAELFEMVYVSRFDRLREQWRREGGAL